MAHCAKPLIRAGLVVAYAALATLSVALCATLVSCTSLSHYEEIDASVAKDDYQRALAQVKAAKEGSYSAKDKILYYLDVGMLAHYAKDRKQSTEALDDAERSIEEAFTKSVTQEASTYLVNDNTRDYPGEDYEDIYLNVFKALNYAEAGKLEDSMVEIRRVDNKIKFLSTKYDKEISSARDQATQKNGDIKYDVDTSPVKFSDSALARYLSMISFRARGKADEARVDQRGLKAAFASQASLYRFPLPKCVDQEIDLPAGKSRLNVVSFTGLSPIKAETTVRIFIGRDKWIKIALPVMKARPSAVASTEVVFDSGERYRLEEIEDMSAVAAETFRAKASLVYFKTVIRALAKTATSVALDKGSQKANSGDAALALSILSLATQAYTELSEQADLRISRYFPGRADVVGISLDPGVYSFSIRYLNASGRVMQETRFDKVEVKKDGLNLVEGICLK